MAQALKWSIEVAGEAQIKRRLDGLMAHTEDLTPALERIAELLEAHFDQAFATEGMATAMQWGPLSARYARWKAKHYPGKGILERTGGLRRSMAQEGGGHIRQVTKISLTVGTARTVKGWNLGLLHQLGTEHMFRRRIINLPDHIKRRITTLIREHVTSES